MKKEKKLDVLHNVGHPNPESLIAFIDAIHLEYRGLCFYDKENKCLASKDTERATFYFDAMHGVIHIIGF